jgi:hypothetical protein
MFIRLLRRYPIAIGVVALVIVSLAAIAFLPKLTSTAVCPITPATSQDLAEARKIGEGIFDPQTWQFQDGEGSNIISLLWLHNSNGALAHSQYLFYNCGYTQADLDRFYGEAGLKVMLGGYNSWTQTAICQKDGLTLREFDIDYEGKPYEARLWVQTVNDKRVRDMRLDFPKINHDLLEQCAAKLFPNFTSCESLGTT